MKKVYQIRVSTNKYEGTAKRGFSVVAPGVNIAMVKAKTLMESHEEIIAIVFLTEVQ